LRSHLGLSRRLFRGVGLAALGLCRGVTGAPPFGAARYVPICGRNGRLVGVGFVVCKGFCLAIYTAGLRLVGQPGQGGKHRPVELALPFAG
jgi:hypothetical protein